MPFLIDGHNLIPKLGLSLGSIDDEVQLIEKLQFYCRVKRQQVEVYFDGAPAGQAGTRRIGMVTAHFVRVGKSADDAITERLKTLGRAARNWRVVSSDRRVQNEARAAGAGVIASADFAKQVNAARATKHAQGDEPAISAAEVEEWLAAFRGNK